MSVLRRIEQKIEGAVERTFGRAFRSSLQPVELARRLAREMEQHKTISVSRVYVPNDFTIYLSEVDRGQFRSYEHSLQSELAAYLASHARGEGLSLVAEPVVRFETDTDLRTGEFGIACRMAEAGGAPAAPPATPAPEREPVVEPVPAYGGESALDEPEPDLEPEEELEAEEELEPEADLEPDEDLEPAGDLEPEAELEPAGDLEPAVALEAEVETPPVPPIPVPMPPGEVHEGLAGVSGTQVFSPTQAADAGVPRETLTLLLPDGRRRITKRVTTLGRSRECDITLADANVSRVHAEIRHIGLDYLLVDQNSTNGIEVNGRDVKRQALADGDVISLGTTEIRVEFS
jgi:hypothetical protein